MKLPRKYWELVPVVGVTTGPRVTTQYKHGYRTIFIFCSETVQGVRSRVYLT